MIVHYYNFTLYPSTDANGVARIQMAKAFSEHPLVDKVYFYFISDKIDAKNLLKKYFTYSKVIPVPIVEPLIKTDPIKPAGSALIFQKITNLVGFVIIFVKIFIHFLVRKNNTNDRTYIRGTTHAILLFLANTLRTEKIHFSLELHNYEFEKNKLRDFLLLHVMSQSKILVTINGYTKNNWVSHEIDKNKIIVLPSGVETQNFDTTADDKNGLRSTVSIPLNQKVIMYVGAIRINRGIEEILYCASKMPQHLFYLIGGTGGQISVYLSHINKYYGQLKNVVFTGYIDNLDIPKYIKSADVLLAPYSSKISTVNHMSPMKLLEYMVSKIPIIVSDLPAIRDMASPEEVIFSTPDNKDVLYAKIKWCLENSDKTESMVQNAYLKASKYSWNNRASEIISRL